ncbi:MAG: hypothetical protein ACPLZG_11690 [Thermoproteota archaeon]
MVSIGQLYSLFNGRKIFPRRRIDPYIKAVAVRKYTLGLSLAQVKESCKNNPTVLLLIVSMVHC